MPDPHDIPRQAPPGTLLAFRVRHGRGARAEGAIDGWLAAVTVAGRAQVHVTDAPLPLVPGTVLVMRPRTWNAWTVPDTKRDWECVYAVFVPRAHWQPWLRHPEVRPGYSLVNPPAEARRGVIAEFERMRAMAQAGGHRREALAANALERALLLCHPGRPADPAVDPRVRAAVEHLRAHLDAPIALRRLAALCGLSRSHLAALFEAQVGEPPIAYHERLRLERAERLLRLSVEPIRAVAAAVGVADPRYFARRFRRRTGTTPARFRAS